MDGNRSAVIEPLGNGASIEKHGSVQKVSMR
jgi:hypothetical protein